MTGNQHFLKENEFGKVDKFATVLLIILSIISAIFNIYLGDVKKPAAFWIVLLGLVLFAIAKLSVIFHKKVISFGSKLMTENMANVYRLGYWLMVVGILLTFVYKGGLLNTETSFLDPTPLKSAIMVRSTNGICCRNPREGKTVLNVLSQMQVRIQAWIYHLQRLSY